ncbi:MAG: hypothetical protein CMM47_04145 [Rhodospirillaceae bacterium]|mgnify:CR=1 FL=1|nr:hypothetical protein [Rhodospirillaceae bacterium]
MRAVVFGQIEKCHLARRSHSHDPGLGLLGDPECAVWARCYFMGIPSPARNIKLYDPTLVNIISSDATLIQFDRVLTKYL